MIRRRLAKLLRGIAAALDDEEPSKRHHPVASHPQAPNVDELEQPSSVTRAHPVGGGHHYANRTPGRWGGPYV